jgi:hypothetical protein
MLAAAAPKVSEATEVPIEAVWAGVAVVVIAAVITALAGHLRTKLSAREEKARLAARLEAEGVRLDARLKAEASRHLEQLAHDRLIRDLEETRTRLDEVIDMGEAALSAICEARLAFNGGNQSAADEQLWQARQCLGQYGYKERRVRLRIDQEHAVISALAEYRQRLQLMYDLAHDSLSQGREVPLDTWSERMAEVAAAQVGIIEAGEASVGARISPPSVPSSTS